ncbi:MAG TPA: hypothetical protein VHY91_20110 [Pirellulales bacterium]|jgi:hypothetical protein|nr:hypothetical protein [Pirellulales bacterium]
MPIDAGLTVSSTEADLTGATVAFAQNTLGAGDTLNFTNQNGITGSYSGGVLTLFGNATAAQYQAALDSITFSTISTVTSPRSLSVAVSAADGSGATIRETVDVAAAPPSVTGATTPENMQASGLVIKPGAGDSSVAYFQIYGITGGTLYQNNGTTPIANNSYITLAQGEAGLKFTPNSGSMVPGGFTVRESTTSGASGLSGSTARAAITVLPASTTATTNLVSLALALQEAGSSRSTPTSTVSNVIPANNSSAPTTSAAGTASSSTGGSGTAGSTGTSSGSHGRYQLAANDEAIADFDLTDLYV